MSSRDAVEMVSGREGERRREKESEGKGERPATTHGGESGEMTQEKERERERERVRQREKGRKGRESSREHRADPWLGWLVGGMGLRSILLVGLVLNFARICQLVPHSNRGHRNSLSLSLLSHFLSSSLSHLLHPYPAVKR